MEIRTINQELHFKRSEDKSMEVSGYALVFDKPSQPLPFIEYIKRNALEGLDLSNVLMLYNHQFGNILARSDSNTLDLSVDENGLKFNARFADTTMANDVYKDIEAGNIKGCSFGFTIAEGGDTWTRNQDNNVVHTINKINGISEVSLTPIPAYKETSVEITRSYEAFLKGEKEEMEINKEVTEIRSNVEELNKKVADFKEENEKRFEEIAKKEEEKRDLKGTDITPKKVDKNEELRRSFEDYLKTGEIKRDITGGIGLTGGKVLIPETILPAEHEVHQFPRLGSLVRSVQVSTTTGKLPIFKTSSDVLATHQEFGKTNPNNAPQISTVAWDLKSYTGAYVFSQELITDSTYNWQAELGSRLTELRDNTDDKLIITALTTGVTAKTTTDLISELKTALNVTLKPIDSQNASIILSQSAYNALDQLKDGMNRPLVQPSVTSATGQTILGKQVIVIDDLLFPSAKAGDVNVLVAPLQKAVIKFKNAEITGQFQDTYDVWYKQLGIFLREDVVQARRDLIVHIKQTAASASH